MYHVAVSIVTDVVMVIIVLVVVVAFITVVIAVVIVAVLWSLQDAEAAAQENVHNVLGVTDEYKARWNSLWEEQERRLQQNLQICQFNFDLRQVNFDLLTRVVSSALT